MIYLSIYLSIMIRDTRLLNPMNISQRGHFYGRNMLMIPWNAAILDHLKTAPCLVDFGLTPARAGPRVATPSPAESPEGLLTSRCWYIGKPWKDPPQKTSGPSGPPCLVTSLGIVDQLSQRSALLTILLGNSNSGPGLKQSCRRPRPTTREWSPKCRWTPWDLSRQFGVNTGSFTASLEIVCFYVL